jgi:hypothetical protein
MTKKSGFLVIFLLTIFDNMLKYAYVSQQANINCQQAKMTFQFACRKLQRSKPTGQQAQTSLSSNVVIGDPDYSLSI